MVARIFVDGASGTTGLEIRERLAARDDIALIQLDDAKRKDARARADALNDADVVILCLPDEAARDAVAMIENPRVRVIDASSAHRVDGGWVYGFPEMEPGQYERIFASRRVSNPGCYPTGFLALIRPLVREGIVPPDWPISVSAISGYSGGGKAMIEEFEDKSSPRYTNAVVRSYSLTLAHKHLPEMKTHSGLSHAPVFSPNVGRFYRGLLVDVPLPLWALPSRPTVMTVHQVLSRAYKGRALVKVGELTDGATMPSLDAEMLNHTNGMKLFVFGNDRNGQARLVALLDNLGKGASGAAVQNLNIMLGLPETAGLA